MPDFKSLTSTGGEVASDPFIAAAIKYGADNGAVISQNSWGYAVGTGRNTSSYINPVHKEAIDYFINMPDVITTESNLTEVQ